MLGGKQSLLVRLGKWRGPLEDALKIGTVISEVCQYIDSRDSHPDDSYTL